MSSDPLLADEGFAFQWLQFGYPRMLSSFFASIEGHPIAIVEHGWSTLVDRLWTDRSMSPADPLVRASIVDREKIRLVGGFEGLNASERMRIADAMDLRPNLAEIVHAARREGWAIVTFEKDLIAYGKRTGFPIVTYRGD